MGRLDGKVALISGGARGQGAAEARLFAREGAKVVIGDILDEEGARVVEQIAEAGGEARFVHLDVTSERDWQQAIATVVDAFGKLNVLVNNAGIWRRGNVEDTTGEHWDTVMEVNAKGVFLGTKLALPEMRKVGGGSMSTFLPPRVWWVACAALPTAPPRERCGCLPSPRLFSMPARASEPTLSIPAR